MGLDLVWWQLRICGFYFDFSGSISTVDTNCLENQGPRSKRSCRRFRFALWNWLIHKLTARKELTPLYDRGSRSCVATTAFVLDILLWFCFDFSGFNFSGRYRLFEESGPTFEEQLSPLCEAPIEELLDTICQDEWNTPECLYDRGSCCFDTCTSVDSSVLNQGNCYSASPDTPCRDPAIKGMCTNPYLWWHYSSVESRKFEYMVFSLLQTV